MAAKSSLLTKHDRTEMWCVFWSAVVQILGRLPVMVFA